VRALRTTLTQSSQPRSGTRAWAVAQVAAAEHMRQA
jgi:hypothetical protein